VLAAGLVAQGIPCTVSVTTATATQLYGADPRLQVWVGRLTEETIHDFLMTQGIAAILDASHPFAVEISHLAIATAQAAALPYLRFERPQPEDITDADITANPVTPVPSLAALLQGDYLAGQRALLILGYRWLDRFRPWQSQATLFARILPSPAALQAALAAGFEARRIIALRPPISAELELALWQQWQLTCVVAKASGQAGGEIIKRQVAAQLGIPLYLIQRPSLSYPQLTDDFAAAIAGCQQWWQNCR
jgi:precorrin-6A/cobalt-precorrin-6A reductase